MSEFWELTKERLQWIYQNLHAFVFPAKDDDDDSLDNEESQESSEQSE